MSNGGVPHVTDMTIKDLSPDPSATSAYQTSQATGHVGSKNIYPYIDDTSKNWDASNIVVVISTAGIMGSFWAAMGTYPIFGGWSFLFIPIGLAIFALGTMGINQVWEAMAVKELITKEIIKGTFWDETDTIMEVDLIVHNRRTIPIEEDEYEEFMEHVEKGCSAAGIKIPEKIEGEENEPVTVIECLTDNIFRREHKNPANEYDQGLYGMFYIVIPDYPQNAELYLRKSIGDAYVKNIWISAKRSVCQFVILGSFNNIPRVMLTFGGGHVTQTVAITKRAMAAAVRDISLELINERLEKKWYFDLMRRLFIMIQKMHIQLPAHDKIIIETVSGLLHAPKANAREVYEAGEPKVRTKTVVASVKGAFYIIAASILGAVFVYVFFLLVGVI